MKKTYAKPTLSLKGALAAVTAQNNGAAIASGQVKPG
ncbi:putative RiPP precursor [Mesorhizobium sp. ZMM04-5]|uniref:RiPP n=1 Tax=Mesorhizobium marinum TaxID=3228790 RepID=A0ABV3QZ89_9HYPH